MDKKLEILTLADKCGIKYSAKEVEQIKFYKSDEKINSLLYMLKSLEAWQEDCLDKWSAKLRRETIKWNNDFRSIARSNSRDKNQELKNKINKLQSQGLSYKSVCEKLKIPIGKLYSVKNNKSLK